MNDNMVVEALLRYMLAEYAGRGGGMNCSDEPYIITRNRMYLSSHLSSHLSIEQLRAIRRCIGAMLEWRKRA